MSTRKTRQKKIEYNQNITDEESDTNDSDHYSLSILDSDDDFVSEIGYENDSKLQFKSTLDLLKLQHFPNVSSKDTTTYESLPIVGNEQGDNDLLTSPQTTTNEHIVIESLQEYGPTNQEREKTIVHHSETVWKNDKRKIERILTGHSPFPNSENITIDSDFERMYADEVIYTTRLTAGKKKQDRINLKARESIENDTVDSQTNAIVSKKRKSSCENDHDNEDLDGNLDRGLNIDGISSTPKKITTKKPKKEKVNMDPLFWHPELVSKCFFSFISKF